MKSYKKINSFIAIITLLFILSNNMHLNATTLGTENLKVEISTLSNSHTSLNWQTVTGATYYELYNNSELIYSGSNTFFEHTNLTPSTQYNYEVVAKNETEQSSVSSLSVKTNDNPFNLRVTAKTETSVSLEWDNQYYTNIVTIKRNNQVVYNGGGTTFTDIGLSAGNNYTYYIYAENGAEINLINNGDFENYTSTNGTADTWIQDYSPSSVGSYSIEKVNIYEGANAQKITLDPSVSGQYKAITKTIPFSPNKHYVYRAYFNLKNATNVRAELYVNYIDKNNAIINFDRTIIPTNNSGYELIELSKYSPANTKYIRPTMIIRNLADGGKGELYIDKATLNDINFDTISVSTNVPTPTNFNATAGYTSMNFTWDPIPGAVFTLKKDNFLIYQGPKTNYNLTNLNIDYNYNFELTAKINSVNSNPITLNKKTLSPNFRSVEKNAMYIKLAWDSVPEAVKYSIERNGNIIYTGTDTTYSDTNLQQNTTYNYKLLIDTGVNLISNNSFETVSGSSGVADGWYKNTVSCGVDKFAIVNTPVIDGTKSQRISCDNIASGAVIQAFKYINVEPNQKYNASALFNVQNLPVGTDSSIVLTFLNYNRQIVGTPHEYYNTGFQINNYNLVKGTGIVPNNASEVLVRYRITNRTNALISSATIFADNTSFTQSSSISLTETTNKGILDITIPNLTNFQEITLNGEIQFSYADISNMQIEDTRGTGEGWRMNVQASQLTQVGGQNLKLANNSLYIKPVLNIEKLYGTNNDISTNISIDTPIDSLTPSTYLQSNINQGKGMYKVTFPSNALYLKLDPGTTKIDYNILPLPTIYQTDIQWSIISGP